MRGKKVLGSWVCLAATISEFADNLWMTDSGRKPTINGSIQDFIQSAGKNKIHVSSHMSRYLLQIFLIALGDDNSFQIGSMSCQDFILYTSHL